MFKRFFAIVCALLIATSALASTRAIQIELLLDGVINPTTGLVVESGSVEFYEAGTSTPKSVWTEKEKTNAYTTYDLDAIGAAQLYGEGNYKIIIKSSAGATLKTIDNVRLEFPYYGIRTVTAGTVTMLSEDDYLLCNTSGGNVTINFLAAADRKRPLKVERISGSNNIIIDPNGSETIDGSATLTISTDAIVEIISDSSNLRTAGYRSGQSDADGDTQMVFDRVLDDDVIRFDIAGDQDVVTIDADGLTADEVDTTVFKIGGTDLTTELTGLDGLTATDTDLNQLDGVTVGGSAAGDIPTNSSASTLTNKGLTSPTFNGGSALASTSTEIDAAADGIGVTIPRQVILEIGSWDMDAISNMSILHGLDYTKIRGVRGVVRNDSGGGYFVITDSYRSATPPDCSISTINSTYVVLEREASGYFDSTDFDSSPYNRGWIVIDYID